MHRNYGLDFLKFICSFMIICIHITLPEMVGAIVVPISRVAVPIFFMITGYFYSITKENNGEKKQLIKITRLLVGANILYMVYSFGISFIKGEGIANYFTLNKIISFILLNDSPFGGHLWYLGAILYVLIIIYFFEKWCNREKLYFLVPFLLLCDLVLGKYSLLFIQKEIPYILVRNFLFVGLPYFLIGDILFKHKINIKSNYLAMLICFFAFTTLAERHLLEAFNLNAHRDHYLSTTFLAVSMFLSACSYGDKPNSRIYKKCCYAGAKLSLGIYIIHPIIIGVLFIAVKFINNITLTNVYYYTAPFLVFVISIAITKIKNMFFQKLKLTK